MNKIAFILALSVMVFTGWLYLGEKDAVRSTKADVVVAADGTAVALSKSANPERNTDADADAIFKKHVQTPSALEDLVKQSVDSISSDRLQQSVKVAARAHLAERILQYARTGGRHHRNA